MTITDPTSAPAGTRSAGTGTDTRVRPAPSRSAERAYQRREKRERRLTHDRLSRTGRPVRSALARVPFVVALIVVLGGGISGVLYVNTKTDESGIHTEQLQQSIAEQNLEIEALQRSIADLDATPRIAQQAQALGMVPAGDAAILQIPASGSPTMIGTPSAVPTPPPTARASSTAVGAVSSVGSASSTAAVPAGSAPKTKAKTVPTTGPTTGPATGTATGPVTAGSKASGANR